MEKQQSNKNLVDKTVHIGYEKVSGHYRATFKIGVQTFFFGVIGTKKDAKWYCDMLEIALTGLVEPNNIHQFKNPMGKQALLDMADPKIIIIKKK
jgi:hypothetical protein